MKDILDFLKEEGVSEELTADVISFREKYPVQEKYRDRIPKPAYRYYGKDVWEISVFNSPGIVLPKTGGVGTRIFAAVGGAMSALAGMLLVLRKKKRFRSS